MEKHPNASKLDLVDMTNPPGIIMVVIAISSPGNVVQPAVQRRGNVAMSGLVTTMNPVTAVLLLPGLVAVVAAVVVIATAPKVAMAALQVVVQLLGNSKRRPLLHRVVSQATVLLAMVVILAAGMVTRDTVASQAWELLRVYPLVAGLVLLQVWARYSRTMALRRQLEAHLHLLLRAISPLLL